MLIDAYRFGRIDVDGQAYTSDVIITPERVLGGWWRKEGHNLLIADLADVIAAKPDIVVVGTGYFGRMAVSEDARRYLEAQGISVRDARTRQAIQDFNQLQDQQARVVAALHLTC
jgi:hypothetical protein